MTPAQWRPGSRTSKPRTSTPIGFLLANPVSLFSYILFFRLSKCSEYGKAASLADTHGAQDPLLAPLLSARFSLFDVPKTLKNRFHLREYVKYWC